MLFAKIALICAVGCSIPNIVAAQALPAAPVDLTAVNAAIAAAQAQASAASNAATAAQAALARSARRLQRPTARPQPQGSAHPARPAQMPVGRRRSRRQAR